MERQAAVILIRIIKQLSRMYLYLYVKHRHSGYYRVSAQNFKPRDRAGAILDDLNCTGKTFPLQTLQNITIYCDVHLSSSLCGFRVKYSSFSDPPARFEGSWSKPQKASNPHHHLLQHYSRHNDFLSGWLLILSDQFGDFQYLIANAIIKIFWVLEWLKNMMMMEISKKVWLCKRFHLWPMLEQNNHSELRHNCKHFFIAF